MTPPRPPPPPPRSARLRDPDRGPPHPSPAPWLRRARNNRPVPGASGTVPSILLYVNPLLQFICLSLFTYFQLYSPRLTGILRHLTILNIVVARGRRGREFVFFFYLFSFFMDLRGWARGSCRLVPWLEWCLHEKSVFRVIP